MSDQEQHMAQDKGDMKMLVAMVSIGLICALLIVLTFEKTKPIIAKNKSEALEAAIFKVLPGISTVEHFMLNEQQEWVEATPDAETQLIYAGYDKKGALKGLAVSAGGQGYADIIRILYGYDPVKQEIVGFYVLESKETPGLGDKIEKDEAFLANFKAMDVSLNDGTVANKIVTVKNGQKKNAWEVDGITGATISSRAIGDILAASTAQWIPLIHAQQERFKKERSNE